MKKSKKNILPDEVFINEELWEDVPGVKLTIGATTLATGTDPLVLLVLAEACEI